MNEFIVILQMYRNMLIDGENQCVIIRYAPIHLKNEIYFLKKCCPAVNLEPVRRYRPSS